MGNVETSAENLRTYATNGKAGKVHALLQSNAKNIKDIIDRPDKVRAASRYS